MLEAIRIGLLVVALTASGLTDLFQRKIYNYVTLPAIGIGLGLAAGDWVFTERLEFLLMPAISMGLALIVFGLPCWLGWMGAGDLKLMLAVGALQGPPLNSSFMIQAIYNTALIGALMALGILIWRGQLLKGLGSSLRWVVRPKSQAGQELGSLPYGVAIALGSLWSLRGLWF